MSVVLHRVHPGRYCFETPGGQTLYVDRATDGTLSSAVIWDVKMPGRTEPFIHFQNLADLRHHDWSYLDE